MKIYNKFISLQLCAILGYNNYISKICKIFYFYIWKFYSKKQLCSLRRQNCIRMGLSGRLNTINATLKHIQNSFFPGRFDILCNLWNTVKGQVDGEHLFGLVLPTVCFFIRICFGYLLYSPNGWGKNTRYQGTGDTKQLKAFWSTIKAPFAGFNSF